MEAPPPMVSRAKNNISSNEHNHIGSSTPSMLYMKMDMNSRPNVLFVQGPEIYTVRTICNVNGSTTNRSFINEIFTYLYQAVRDHHDLMC